MKFWCCVATTIRYDMVHKYKRNFGSNLKSHFNLSLGAAYNTILCGSMNSEWENFHSKPKFIKSLFKAPERTFRWWSSYRRNDETKLHCIVSLCMAFRTRLSVMITNSFIRLTNHCLSVRLGWKKCKALVLGYEKPNCWFIDFIAHSFTKFVRLLNSSNRWLNVYAMI